MKMQLKYFSRMELVRYRGQTVLKIQFNDSKLKDWCLTLCLLKEQLIEKVIAGEEHGKARMEIQVFSDPNVRSRGHVIFGSESTNLKVTHNELDYLLCFCLKYYRDGIAEVDHLDLEVTSSMENQNGYITFMFSNAIKPLSTEEASKKLGLC